MGYRVLIVDDSPVLCAMLGEMLRSLGHEVVAEAGESRHALTTFIAMRPDVVLLDISLPAEDGLVVLQKLRDLDPQAKVLLVTANPQLAIREKAMTLGALGILHKPFTTQELAAALANIEPQMRGET